MKALTEQQKQHLRKVFDYRITFDEIEQKIYSHDVGEIPFRRVCCFAYTPPATWHRRWEVGWHKGGSGIGSYESGWFSDNVVSTRVVLLTGEVRIFSGKELNLVSEACGTTGIISEITVRVQPLENLDVISIQSPTA